MLLPVRGIPQYTSVQLAVNRSGVYYIAGYRYCLVCLSRMWCAATMFTKYCGSRALEKLSSLCTKLILNRDQLVKYLGFPMPELEIIYPICAKGCRKIRDAEFLEDIRTLFCNCSTQGYVCHWIRHLCKVFIKPDVRIHTHTSTCTVIPSVQGDNHNL